MRSAQALTRIGCALASLAFLCLASLCLHGATAAYDWEPIPAQWPARLPLAYASAAGLFVLGALLATRRYAPIGAIGLATMLAAWILGLHLPRVLGSAGAAWIAMFECVAVASGLLLAATARLADADRRERVARLAALAFGASLVSFGYAHFRYAAATAAMVPSWLPARTFWAYGTGAAHIAAGLSIASRRLDRWSAPLLSIMFAGFTLLVNLPQAAGSTTLGAAAVGLCFAIALTGSPLVITGGVLARRINSMNTGV